MSYKKDMSKYEHLEGWERCGFGEQLDKWAETKCLCSFRIGFLL